MAVAGIAQSLVQFRRWCSSVAGVAQLAEQLICNQQVAGSSPIASSMPRDERLGPCSHCHGPAAMQQNGLRRSRTSAIIPEGCPRGQWEQTVNLPAYAYGGSNPPPSTRLFGRRCKRQIDCSGAGIAQLVERQPSKLNVAGSNPVSRSNANAAPSHWFRTASTCGPVGA